MVIDTIENLRAHLRTAVLIEHSTVPLYLFALYSLKSQLSNAAQTIRGVATQEMLHMSVAANLLNAVGERPNFADKALRPTFPGPLPHHQPLLILDLERASLALVRNVFLEIEHPMTRRDVPEAGPYVTIGQFYEAVVRGFELLVRKYGERGVFTGDPALQLTEGYEGGYADADGRLIAVYDLATAKQAIHEIVREGEGTDRSEDDGTGELAHFWRFNQIGDGTFPLGETYPVMQDPKTSKLPPGTVRQLSQLFNDCYGLLLRLMTAVFSTPEGPHRTRRPSRRDLVGAFVPLMFRVLRPVASCLVQTPVPGRAETAGPSFEYSTTPQTEILENCKELSATYPDLHTVVQALSCLPPIDAVVETV